MTTSDFQLLSQSSMRRAVARAMSKSKREAPRTVLGNGATWTGDSLRAEVGYGDLTTAKMRS